ncbi:MAG TPA: site-specific integrase [Thiobacillus sp.]
MQERPGQIGAFWLSQQRGSDKWYRTWYDPDTRQTRRKTLGTSDFQEAKLKLWEWFARKGHMPEQQPQEASLDMVLVRYYQQHAIDLPSAEMAKIALRYWSDFFGGCTVSEVTPARQREFIAWLREGGRSDGYIKRILNVGKSALNRAYREGEIASVPFVLPGSDGEARDRVLTVGESAALWRAAKLPHERMMLALLYGTLARPEAALALRKEFYDPERRLLTQNPPGRRQTKKYRPVVPVGEFLRPWLENAPPGPLVAWHGKPIASFKTAWRKMRAEAGLEQAVVPKTIRHTMATELRAAGVPEAEIQGMLGHRAYSGRTEVYAKYRPDYLGAAVRAVDAYMARVLVAC